MKIIFYRDFLKRYWKLRLAEQKRTDERMRLFQQNPFHPLLGNHALNHQYGGCRSINITGDLRAVYEEVAPQTVHFVTLGTHTELYE